MPARIFPPGKIPSYSNYGFTLAGYIVERVSGEKFERYIDNHILKPLRMTSSTFDQPLPPQLAPQMSKAYLNASKKLRDFEFVQHSALHWDADEYFNGGGRAAYYSGESTGAGEVVASACEYAVAD